MSRQRGGSSRIELLIVGAIILIIGGGGDLTLLRLAYERE